MDLKNISTDDLVAEMEKRKKEVGRPKLQFETHDKMEELVSTCECIINEIIAQGYSKNQESFIYESVFKCLYGYNVFDWLNEHDKGC